MKTTNGIRIAAASASTILMFWLPLAARAEVAGGVIGCDASGKKQEGGAVLGAVIGGVAGNNLAKNDRRTGTVIGATAGAAVGSYVGCQMQKGDAAKAAPPRTHTVVNLNQDREPAVVPVREEGRRGFTPPGLTKKPHRMPPGQAKKYNVGERLPGSYVQARYFVASPQHYRLRPAPAGFQWVLLNQDAYLVRTRTGVVAKVARAIVG